MLGGLFGPLNTAAGPDAPASEPPKVDYVKKFITVEIRGTLEEEKGDILLPDGVSLKVRVEGQNYYLDLRGNKTLWGKARNSMYQRVIVTGTLDQGGRVTVVRVTTLDAAPPEIIACGIP
jgi:hypothetical protein